MPPSAATRIHGSVATNAVLVTTTLLSGNID